MYQLAINLIHKMYSDNPMIYDADLIKTQTNVMQSNNVNDVSGRNERETQYF